MRRHRLVAVGLGIGVGIGLAACTSVHSLEGSAVPDAMQLSSPAFTDGGAIPEEHTCDGGNLSPPLAWEEVPEGVESFALIVTDPDAGGFVHWVLTRIPAEARDLAEGEGDGAGTPGRNGFGDIGWGGPCPPSGEHRYVFELFALSGVEIGSGATYTAGQLRSAMQGGVLAVGELSGVYARR